MIESIFARIKHKREFSARPILRCIEQPNEDKVTDIILDSEEPHIFTENDF